MSSVGRRPRLVTGDGKINQLIEQLPDRRSGRVVFLSHCLLNQNVRYLGGATRAGAIDEIVDQYQREGIGICQMPCPEQLAWGGVLKRRTLRLYASRGSLAYRFRHSLGRLFFRYTRARYRLLARSVTGQIADYTASGFDVVGVVGISGSPSCGVLTTMDLGQAIEGVSRCELKQFTTRRLNEGIVLRARRRGAGLFMRALQRELASRQRPTTFLETDLSEQLLSDTAKQADTRSGVNSLNSDAAAS